MTGFLARKNGDFGGFVRFPVTVKKTTVFLPAPLQLM
jgi:hypothetical protein